MMLIDGIQNQHPILKFTYHFGAENIYPGILFGCWMTIWEITDYCYGAKDKSGVCQVKKWKLDEFLAGTRSLFNGEWAIGEYQNVIFNQKLVLGIPQLIILLLNVVLAEARWDEKPVFSYDLSGDVFFFYFSDPDFYSHIVDIPKALPTSYLISDFVLQYK